MSSIVLGVQWGDEGKGKIVDALSNQFDWTIRFAGGANAGHTIVSKGIKYVFHLLPSGILHKNTQVLLGPATVIDPSQLMLELQQLSDQNVEWKGRVHISERAHIVLPSHKKEDIKIEKKRAHKIGTTGRGIGISYSKKMLRTGLRITDIDDVNLTNGLSSKDRNFLQKHSSLLKSLAINHHHILQVFNSNEKILFEGAQGILLDSDFGTYPFVTSGPTGINGVASTGFPIKKAKKIIGVAKIYCSRVGEGPFPSEFRTDEAELHDIIQSRGNEKGSSTGRMRRCGHLDLISLRYACQVAGIDSLALTHLDVLDVLATIKVCVGYEVENEYYDYVPSNVKIMNAIDPVMRKFPGWKTASGNIKRWGDLPKNALDYISFLESYLEIPIDILSLGPDREQMLFKNKDAYLDNL